MTNYEESFFKDPWEYITGPNYPEVNLLFRDDMRFYVSINEMNQKLFVFVRKYLYNLLGNRKDINIGTNKTIDAQKELFFIKWFILTPPFKIHLTNLYIIKS